MFTCQSGCLGMHAGVTWLLLSEYSCTQQPHNTCHIHSQSFSASMRSTHPMECWLVGLIASSGRGLAQCRAQQSSASAHYPHRQWPGSCGCCTLLRSTRSCSHLNAPSSFGTSYGSRRSSNSKAYTVRHSWHSLHGLCARVMAVGNLS